MADTDIALYRTFFQHPAKFIELPHRTANLELAIGGQRGDARRVVTTIFKPLQPRDQYRRSLPGTSVSDYSAHGYGSWRASPTLAAPRPSPIYSAQSGDSCV